MREIAAQVLTLAQKQGTNAPLLMAHRFMGISLLCTGDIVEGRAHLEQAIALYDAAEHRPLATRFGLDAGVHALSYRSWALWLLGYPDAALTGSHRALSDAREIGQAATLMGALVTAMLPHICCGNYVMGNLLVDELVALAEAKGTLLWDALGRILRGGVLTLKGNSSDVVQMITSGIDAEKATGATFFIPWFASSLASAYAELGKIEDAGRCIGEAMTAAESTKEKWYEAEINRIAGEIALKPPERDTAKAESYFERALTVARQQQAKSWELRAAMSLARLWRDQGKRDEARELLAPVYGWFTEGFETRDLKEAKALLDELGA